ncbi:nuclear nucleic acid-binding protein C1D-like [Panulirus ornatus]|uniref:nuclear nucleic acid-binding protein C1D-like n=1 Tax=Panulirus ornatus TaxID=150431 RepID=UPI003A8B95DC
MEDVKPEVLSGTGETSHEDVPPGMAPKMLNLLKVVDKLERDLKPLISRQYYEVLNKLLPLERAKIGMMEIYTINSLFWVLMRTVGEDVDSSLRDDYKVEMGRLKETQARIAQVEARANRCQVDTQAAARFIRHGLGLNTRGEDERAGVEEDESSVYMARKRQKIQEQIKEQSNSSSESEDEEESDGNNDVDAPDGDRNRSWYGKGW